MSKSLKIAARYAAVFLCIAVLVFAQVMTPQTVDATSVVVAGTALTYILFSLLVLCGVGLATNSDGTLTQGTIDTINAFDDNTAMNYPAIYVWTHEQAQLHTEFMPGGDPNFPNGTGVDLAVSATLLGMLMDAAQDFFGTANSETGQGSVNIEGDYNLSWTGFNYAGTGLTYPLGSDLALYPGGQATENIIVNISGSSVTKVEAHFEFVNSEFNVLTASGFVKQYFSSGSVSTENYDSRNVSGNFTGYQPIGDIIALASYNNKFINPLCSMLFTSNIGSGFDFSYQYLTAENVSTVFNMSGDVVNYITGASVINGNTTTWNNTSVYTEEQLKGLISTSNYLDTNNNRALQVGVSSSTLPSIQTDVLTVGQINTLRQLYPDVEPDVTPEPSVEKYPTTDFISPPATAAQDDIDNMKAPSLIFQKFPFCIPWDLYAAFAVLQADAVAPVFTFMVPINFSIIGGSNSEYEIEVDFSEYETAIAVFRWCVLVTFVVGLVLATRKLIGN